MRKSGNRVDAIARLIVRWHRYDILKCMHIKSNSKSNTHTESETNEADNLNADANSVCWSRREMKSIPTSNENEQEKTSFVCAHLMASLTFDSFGHALQIRQLILWHSIILPVFPRSFIKIRVFFINFFLFFLCFRLLSGESGNSIEDSPEKQTKRS